VHTEKYPTEPKRKMYTRGDPKQKPSDLPTPQKQPRNII
jgi:hypothetical protein